MSLFRLDSSVRGDLSVSRAVADTAEAAWRREHPSAAVVKRDLVADPIPTQAWSLVVTSGAIPADERTADARQAFALAERFRAELLDADAYILAVPLYNYGVSQHVKAWIDLIMSDLDFSRTQPLKGRPATIITTRGGGYAPGTPRAGWDHATPYYSRIFGDVFGMDLHLNEIELTLAEVTPAMESLRDKARELLSTGHSAAEKHGELLARRVLSGVAA